jgi:hypothetical protein
MNLLNAEIKDTRCKRPFIPKYSTEAIYPKGANLEAENMQVVAGSAVGVDGMESGTRK